MTSFNGTSDKDDSYAQVFSQTIVEDKTMLMYPTPQFSRRSPLITLSSILKRSINPKMMVDKPTRTSCVCCIPISKSR